MRTPQKGAGCWQHMARLWLRCSMLQARSHARPRTCASTSERGQGTQHVTRTVAAFAAPVWTWSKYISIMIIFTLVYMWDWFMCVTWLMHVTHLIHTRNTWCDRRYPMRHWEMCWHIATHCSTPHIWLFTMTLLLEEDIFTVCVRVRSCARAHNCHHALRASHKLCHWIDSKRKKHCNSSNPLRWVHYLVSGSLMRGGVKTCRQPQTCQSPISSIVAPGDCVMCNSCTPSWCSWST